MNPIQRLAGVALVAAAGAFALAAPSFAAIEDAASWRDTSFAPDYYNREIDKYRDYIARMSPENRAKLAAMQDKLMQMEMDHKMATMKMDMEMAKARRDMELFIIQSGFPFQSEGR
jgi:replicative superfamily II helicase